MYFQVNGLEISNLQKADSDLISVDIVANHLTEDPEGELILKEAFNDDTVNSFLQEGVIDFWHDSDNEDFSKENVLGSYIHLYFPSNPKIVHHFLSACENYNDKKT